MDQKNFIVAIVLSVLIIVGWQYAFRQPSRRHQHRPAADDHFARHRRHRKRPASGCAGCSRNGWRAGAAPRS